MDARYVEICGISEVEVHNYFKESIEQLASANGMSFKEACEKLRKQYNGYHFEHDTVGIYNPFSLLNTFDSKAFKNYWFQTATPTFLVKLLKQNDYDLRKLQKTRATSSTIGNLDTILRDPIPVIYQSGYLTIRRVLKSIENNALWG